MNSLRAMRLERTLSIDGLADLAGVSNKTIVDIEAGRVRPKLRTVRRLSEALRVSPQDIREFAVVLGLVDQSTPRIHLVGIQPVRDESGAIKALLMSAHEPHTDVLCLRLVTITAVAENLRIESELGGTRRVLPHDFPGFGDVRPLLESAQTVIDLVRDKGPEREETRRLASAFLWQLNTYILENPALI